MNDAERLKNIVAEHKKLTDEKIKIVNEAIEKVEQYRQDQKAQHTPT